MKVRLLPQLNFEDAAPGMNAHVQGAHLQSGHLLGMNILGYSTSSNHCFVFPARQLHLQDHPGLGLRQLVAATHEKPLQHKLSKCGVGLLGKRPVQLDQQSQVDVLALGLLEQNLLLLVVWTSSPVMAPSAQPGLERENPYCFIFHWQKTHSTVDFFQSSPESKGI